MKHQRDAGRKSWAQHGGGVCPLCRGSGIVTSNTWRERARKGGIRSFLRSFQSGQLSMSARGRRGGRPKALTIEDIERRDAALDSPTRQSLIGALADVLRETKVTTVLITHDRNEAQALADEVAVLMGGKILQIGPPPEIFSRPADEEVARFVGVENLLKGTIAASRNGIAEINVQGRVIEAVCDSKAGEEVYVCLRPEDITLSLIKSSTSARNVFPV